MHDAVGNPVQPGIRTKQLMFKSHREHFHDGMQGVYAQAIKQLAASSDIFDLKTFVAVCVRFLQFNRRTREQKDVLILLSRVLGHDRRTINIEDNRSYQDIVKQIQGELATVQGEAVVKETLAKAQIPPDLE